MNKNEQTIEKEGLSRRGFLTKGAIVLGGTFAAFTFGCTPIRRGISKAVENMGYNPGIKEFNPLFWFEVLPDNNILMTCPKVEMGQGIFTGLALLAAEELEVPLSQIKVVAASTQDGLKDSLGTGGSASTAALYTPVREVAANMREMLKTAAANIWQTSPSNITAQNGQLITGTHSMSYAQVVAQTNEWKVPKKAPQLKSRSDFKQIGTDVKRVDLRPKVMGDPIFAIDAELPDMLYAISLECPYIGGQLKSLDSSAAKQVAGVIDVIQEDKLIAVVAQNRYAAEMGKRQLKAEWDLPKVWQQTHIDQLVKVGSGKAVNIEKEGKVKAIFETAPEAIITSEYRTPTGIHGHLEPNGAIAKVNEDNILIIVGTQDSNRLRNKVAKALGVNKKTVEVKNSFLGGGFGGRYFEYEAVQAAKVSKKMGRAVQLFKDREEEFSNGYYRPATHHILKATIDNGDIQAIEHLVAGASMVLSELPAMAQKMIGADFMTTGHGAKFVYDIPNRSTTIYDAKMPFRTGIWRGVGAFLNAFPMECYMDELAHNTTQDPIDFRLRHLHSEDNISKRLKKVVETARVKSKWDSPKASDVGRGFACFKDRETLVAAVAEVKIVDGKIKVSKMTNVIDAGLIVNPEGVRTQVEGCVMMGISVSLYEDIQVKDGQFSASNFHQYPMASLSDTPEIEVIMIEGAEEPYGVGEPPITVIAPAIANAVFDLTGKRLTQLPLRI